jgi:hypothetical protein
MSTIIAHPALEAHPDLDAAARKRADRLAKATTDQLQAALAYLSMIDPEAFEIAFTAVAPGLRRRQVRRRRARPALQHLRRPGRHLPRAHPQLVPLARRQRRLRHSPDLRPRPRSCGRVVPPLRESESVLAAIAHVPRRSRRRGIVPAYWADRFLRRP